MSSIAAETLDDQNQSELSALLSAESGQDGDGQQQPSLVGFFFGGTADNGHFGFGSNIASADLVLNLSFTLTGIASLLFVHFSATHLF